MKNIISILLILFIPIITYLFLSQNTNTTTAIALETNKPTVITFSSTMCMDCQRIKPIIKELEETYNDKIKFIYINATEQNQNTQTQIQNYKITLVPTMILINKKGEVKDRIEGYTEKENLTQKIEAIINE